MPLVVNGQFVQKSEVPLMRTLSYPCDNIMPISKRRDSLIV